jgi:hypothetical protein
LCFGQFTLQFLYFVIQLVNLFVEKFNLGFHFI